MTTYAKVIEDSISEYGIRLTTIEAHYPLIIHAQAKTHRIMRWIDDDQYELVLKQDVDLMSDPMLSRNAASNRAIPTRRILDQVDNDPFYPDHWGKNQPGMQANTNLTDQDVLEAEAAWERGIRDAISCAEKLNIIGVHKELVNRVLMPFQYITVIVTATEWDNFFHLRLAHDAQPEIQELARCMKKAMNESEPKLLNTGEWHLPYVTEDERNTLDIEVLPKISGRRCARISYLNHDKSNPDVKADIARADELIAVEHLSPFEHQGTPMETPACLDICDIEWGGTHIDTIGDQWSGNLRGWIQYRQVL